MAEFKMLEENYVALYSAGNIHPIGIMRESKVKQLLEDLDSRNYWTLPIVVSANALSQMEIVDDISRYCSKRLDDILDSRPNIKQD